MGRLRLRFSKHWKRALLMFLVVIALFLIPLVAYEAFYFGKIPPGILIADLKVSNMSPVDAATFLAESVNTPKNITITGKDQSFVYETESIELSYDFAETVNRAYTLTRTGNPIYDVVKKAEIAFSPINIGLSPKFNGEKLDNIISIISGQNFVDPIYPSIKIVSGEVVVEKGSPGKEVDMLKLRAEIGNNLAFAKEDAIKLPVNNINATLSDTEAATAKLRAERYVGKTLNINTEGSVFTYKDTDLVLLIDPKSGFDMVQISTNIDRLAKNIERAPQNPKFSFENERVTEFLPALEGIQLDKEKTVELLTSALQDLEAGNEKSLSINAPIIKTPPEITTDKVNNLGIKELLGRGTSTFYGSIPSRVHNVALAASRINGVLIPPGETFSFNESLGDVSKLTGYQEAYIISEGRTILGDGGGVCQVSTTLFRSILNAGLPITERAAHSYRVGYYEQNSPPGLDATVYGPSPDLKFTNDTPGHILIQAKTNTKNYSLVFELYGTSDGRTASVSKPVVSNVSAPPEDRYQDDPTLPPGTVKQVEYKAWGARVVFNYKVTRDGKEIYSKTFVSNYKPWGAVYLRGVE